MSMLELPLEPHSLFNGPTEITIACYHCGLPVLRNTDFGVSFDGIFRGMCCVGCEAVAKTIIDAGLGSYYRQRSALPAVDGLANAARSNVHLPNFDLPEIQSSYVSAANAGEAKSAAFYIDGVTCNACLWLAESALKRVSGVTSATVNYVTHRAELKWSGSETTLASIIDAVTRVGLQAMPVSAAERQVSRARERRVLFIQLGVALLAMMQVMMFTVPLYFTAADDISHEAQRLMQWASLVLTLPVVLYSAKPFWQGALRDLRTWHLSMDAPVALAIASTFATSLWSIFTEQGALYFDSISMFVFLLLASRYLESSIRDRALSRIERLTNAVPAVATRLIGYPNSGESTEITTAALKPDDVILVPTGQIIAADSVLLEGAGEVDEAIVTGESRSVNVGIGSKLIGGTLNMGAPLIARVTRVGTASTLASIARLAERSLGERPQLTALTDRVASIVAPSLIVLACLAGVVWFFIDSAQSFNVTVTVLAVTCPCAIALAAPLAYTSATLTISKNGLLIARGHVLEALPTITDVVFDKTGTLTTGQLVITDIKTAEGITRDEALAIAATLETGAVHPIASAIKAIAPSGEKLIAQQLRLIPGGGVEGAIGEKTYRLGYRAFALAAAVGFASDDAFVLSCDGKWLATFETEDALKTDAAKTISSLQQTGLTVHLLSGDRALRVKSVAQELGINDEHTFAAQTPLQKLAYLEQLRKAGHKVAMIGDGVNDAPVLGAADVSIAMGAGADLPRLTADAVLLSPSLLTIATALRLARRTKNVIKQNFGWAIFYNLIAIPLALANVINPAWAAIGMGVSGLIVVLNSMRLLRRTS
jgi:P-type Cu2+ transporter